MASVFDKYSSRKHPLLEEADQLALPDELKLDEIAYLMSPEDSAERSRVWREIEYAIRDGELKALPAPESEYGLIYPELGQIRTSQAQRVTMAPKLFFENGGIAKIEMKVFKDWLSAKGLWPLSPEIPLSKWFSKKRKKTPQGIEDTCKPTRESHLHKQIVRKLSQKIWAKKPEITIADMIISDEISKATEPKVYHEETLRNWIKDLAPNRTPGRRPRKTK